MTRRTTSPSWAEAVPPLRAKTKGKIESGVKYVRRNVVCGLLGREPSCLMDFNAELRQRVDTVVNHWVHGPRANKRCCVGTGSVQHATGRGTAGLFLHR